MTHPISFRSGVHAVERSSNLLSVGNDHVFQGFLSATLLVVIDTAVLLRQTMLETEHISCRVYFQRHCTQIKTTTISLLLLRLSGNTNLIMATYKQQHALLCKPYTWSVTHHIYSLPVPFVQVQALFYMSSTVFYSSGWAFQLEETHLHSPPLPSLDAGSPQTLAFLSVPKCCSTLHLWLKGKDQAVQAAARMTVPRPQPWKPSLFEDSLHYRGINKISKVEG